MIQKSLFGEEAEQKTEPTPVVKARAPQTRQLIPPPPPKVDELINHIEREMYLWDMRCWDERTREQAEQWVAAIKAGERDHKNCGHVYWCIENLLRQGVDQKIIVDAIMRNDQIQYANRLVRCFGGADKWENHPCPKAREAGNYRDAHCEECQSFTKVQEVAAERVRMKRKLRAAGVSENIRDLPTGELRQKVEELTTRDHIPQPDLKNSTGKTGES
jgi:hypothetical protein